MYFLEQKLKKDLLWPACRHHIMEVMLEVAVAQELGSSIGPEILNCNESDELPKQHTHLRFIYFDTS